MPGSTFPVDISVLPDDVFSLYDDKFYEIVKRFAGPDEAKLLEIQGIRSVYSFLYTEDPFEVFELACGAMADIKKSMCLLLYNKTHIVKPGCKSNLRYLTQLLNSKSEEQLKRVASRTKPKRQQLQQVTGITTNVTPFDTSLQSSSASSTPAQLTQTTATSGSMNEQNHRDFIVRQLDEWYNKNQTSLNLRNGKFIENVDFKLTITLDHSVEEARMSCSCGVRIQLGKERRNFSLSNFYKHIKSLRCTMMKNKRVTVSSNGDNEEEDLDAGNESFQDETPESDPDDFSTPLAEVQNTNDHRTHRGSSKKRAASSSWSSSVKKK